MLRLISDENLHGDIVRGLRRRLPSLDLIRIQDVGLSGIDDPGLLSWASEQERILFTHDRTTMPMHVAERLREGMSVTGLFIVDDRASLGLLIDELALVIQCSEPAEWSGSIIYFPLSRDRERF